MEYAIKKALIKNAKVFGFNQSFSEEQLAFLYNCGVLKFKSGDYKKSADIFQLLNVFDGSNPLYSKSLAASLQASGDFFLAVIWYKNSYMMNEKEIDCLYYSGVCHFEIGEHSAALNYFNKYLTCACETAYEYKARIYIKLINNLLEGNK